jgi:hypothetical protein
VGPQTQIHKLPENEVFKNEKADDHTNRCIRWLRYK